MGILIVPGADGSVLTGEIRDAVQAGLGQPVTMANLDGAEVGYRAWSQVLAPLLAEHPTVIGHGLGGSIVLKMLTECDPGVTRLLVLAAPDWGPTGWDVAEFALPADAAERLPPGLRVELHHCVDDAVVPFEHHQRLAAQLPRAQAIYRRNGGHRFEAPASLGIVRRLLGPRPIDDPGPFFHGTRLQRRVGDLLSPGHRSNYGSRGRANFVYVTALAAGAGLAAELALGDAAPRVYRVEPTGLLEDDPNVTDQRFAGNPTRSYRTREPVRVVGVLEQWERQPPEELRRMREAMAGLRGRGIEAIND